MSDSVPGNPVWLLARFFDLEGELGLAKTLVRSKDPHELHEKFPDLESIEDQSPDILLAREQEKITANALLAEIYGDE